MSDFIAGWGMQAIKEPCLCLWALEPYGAFLYDLAWVSLELASKDRIFREAD